METKIKLPVGVDSFEKIHNGNYYYVDKTMLIEQVLDEGSDSVYSSATFWKDPEYEHAEKFF